jgi:hypothetical protein
MKGVRSSSSGSSAGSWVLELCLSKEKAGASKFFKIFLTIASTENSSPCKISLERTIGVPKTASAGERPVSFLGLCTEAQEYKR